MEGPESHLQALGIELPGAVDSSALAALTPDYRVVVNGRFYWTSSAEQKSEFLAAPHRYVDIVQDPVTKQWFEPTSSSPHRSRGDEIVYFQGFGSAEAFASEP